MKLVICAGPATTGKTSVLRHATGKLLRAGRRVAFLKLNVQYADEDELLAKEFGIPTRKVYTGELCPDHCHVMVLGDALHWAEQSDCDVLLVETAGLCLRCCAVRGRRTGRHRAGGHQRHELAVEGRPHALPGRHGRGDQDRSRFAGGARGIPGPHPGRCPQHDDPRGQRPARHRHRPLVEGDPRHATTLPARFSSAAIRPWAPARSASARRRSAGNPISAWSARWRTRRFTGENSRAARIYFDNAATTAPDPRVLEAMRPYLDEVWGNPSSLYAEGRQARQAVERVRAQVAGLLGAEPGEIVFTGSGTEADNMALQGVLLAAGLPARTWSPAPSSIRPSWPAAGSWSAWA